MLVDRVLPGTNNRRFEMPQLDTFVEADPGTAIENGEEVFRSEAAAVEAHVDDYLYKFCESFYAVAKALGPRQAMNLILERRNRDRLRCRLLAARELADLATADPAALRALAVTECATGVEADHPVVVRERAGRGQHRAPSGPTGAWPET